VAAAHGQASIVVGIQEKIDHLSAALRIEAEEEQEAEQRAQRAEGQLAVANRQASTFKTMLESMRRAKGECSWTRSSATWTPCGTGCPTSRRCVLALP
jgi:hypothetical protein